MTSTVPVSGIGNVHVNPYEETSKNILDKYMDYMKDIQEIFNKGKWTASDYNKLIEAMKNLKSLALKGEVSPYGEHYYMPKSMLGKLDTVFAMLKGVGITIDAGLTPKEGLAAMQELKNWVSDDGNKITFGLVLTNAVGELTGAARTLQSMLETEFVLRANGQYDKKLSSLEDQINVSKQIIDFLADLQDYRNKRIKKPGTPGWDDNTGKNPIRPDIVWPKAEDMKELQKYLTELEKLIKELKDRRISPNDPNYAKSPAPAGSLEEALTKIRDDLSDLKGLNFDDPTDFMTGDNIVSGWLLDGNYAVGGDAGKFQDHINKANNTALSLNDSQKDELRSTQYNYEQFMKIATSLMDNLNKLIVRFAQGASK